MSEKKKAPSHADSRQTGQHEQGAVQHHHDTPGSVNQEHADREHRKPMRDPDIIRFWGVPSDE